MIEFEEWLVKVTEENYQAAGTLRKYIVANKKFQEKLAREELISPGALHE